MTKTILVVDDEHEIASAVRSILEDEGYKIDVCGDGRDAIDYLSHSPAPHLLLTDLMMPRADGYTLIQHVRADRKLKAVPVVLMSGATPVKRSNAAWDAFLRKPFTLDALIDTVRRLAGGS